MTEKEFWKFMQKSWNEKGRIPQVSGYIDNDSPEIQEMGRYISGHSVLFWGYEKLPVKTINKIGELLFNKKVTKKAKETILVMLAHHPSQAALEILQRYNKKPDRKLKYMAAFALQECEEWNE